MFQQGRERPSRDERPRRDEWLAMTAEEAADCGAFRDDGVELEDVLRADEEPEPAHGAQEG